MNGCDEVEPTFSPPKKLVTSSSCEGAVLAYAITLLALELGAAGLLPAAPPVIKPDLADPAVKPRGCNEDLLAGWAAASPLFGEVNTGRRLGNEGGIMAEATGCGSAAGESWLLSGLAVAALDDICTALLADGVYAAAPLPWPGAGRPNPRPGNGAAAAEPGLFAPDCRAEGC